MSSVITDLHGVKLDPRFEIRRLEPKHEEWALAVAMHSNVYQSDVWAGLYIGQQARVCLEGFNIAKGAYMPAITDGWALGVFDKEYQYKRPESAATEGALYWHELDGLDTMIETDGRRVLRDAMDFPLVSVAMGCDASDPAKAGFTYRLLGRALPMGLFVFSITARKREAEPASAEPAKPEELKAGEVLQRTGTATADGYMGMGLMKATAHFLMHEAKSKGFKQIRLGALSPAVFHVWTNPPAPYRAEATEKLDYRAHETIVNGEKVKLFENCGPGTITAGVVVHLDGPAS